MAVPNNEAIVKVKLLAYFKEQLVKIFAPKDVATTLKEGLMSKDDKAKLDGIAVNANKYEHPTTHPATMIVEDDTHKFITAAERTAWDGAKTAGEKLRTEYDAHIAGIAEVTDAEVKSMLDNAGLNEIA